MVLVIAKMYKKQNSNASSKEKETGRIERLEQMTSQLTQMLYMTASAIHQQLPADTSSSPGRPSLLSHSVTSRLAAMLDCSGSGRSVPAIMDGSTTVVSTDSDKKRKCDPQRTTNDIGYILSSNSTSHSKHQNSTLSRLPATDSHSLAECSLDSSSEQKLGRRSRSVGHKSLREGSMSNQIVTYNKSFMRTFDNIQAANSESERLSRNRSRVAYSHVSKGCSASKLADSRMSRQRSRLTDLPRSYRRARDMSSSSVPSRNRSCSNRRFRNRSCSRNRFRNRLGLGSQFRNGSGSHRRSRNRSCFRKRSRNRSHSRDRLRRRSYSRSHSKHWPYRRSRNRSCSRSRFRNRLYARRRSRNRSFSRGQFRNRSCSRRRSRNRLSSKIYSRNISPTRGGLRSRSYSRRRSGNRSWSRRLSRNRSWSRRPSRNRSCSRRRFRKSVYSRMRVRRNEMTRLPDFEKSYRTTRSRSSSGNSVSLSDRHPARNRWSQDSLKISVSSNIGQRSVRRNSNISPVSWVTNVASQIVKTKHNGNGGSGSVHIASDSNKMAKNSNKKPLHSLHEIAEFSDKLKMASNKSIQDTAKKTHGPNKMTDVLNNMPARVKSMTDFSVTPLHLDASQVESDCKKSTRCSRTAFAVLTPMNSSIPRQARLHSIRSPSRSPITADDTSPSRSPIIVDDTSPSRSPITVNDTRDSHCQEATTDGASTRNQEQERKHHSEASLPPQIDDKVTAQQRSLGWSSLQSAEWNSLLTTKVQEKDTAFRPIDVPANQLCGFVAIVSRPNCTLTSVILKPVCTSLSVIPKSVCTYVSGISKPVCTSTSVILKPVCTSASVIPRTVCTSTLVILKPVCTSTAEIPTAVCTSASRIPKPFCTSTSVIPRTVCTSTLAILKPVCTPTAEMPKAVCTSMSVIPKAVCTSTLVIPRPVCTSTSGIPKPVCTITSVIPKAVCTSTSGILKPVCTPMVVISKAVCTSAAEIHKPNSISTSEVLKHCCIVTSTSVTLTKACSFPSGDSLKKLRPSANSVIELVPLNNASTTALPMTGQLPINCTASLFEEQKSTSAAVSVTSANESLIDTTVTYMTLPPSASGTASCYEQQPPTSLTVPYAQPPTSLSIFPTEPPTSSTVPYAHQPLSSSTLPYFWQHSTPSSIAPHSPQQQANNFTGSSVDVHSRPPSHSRTSFSHFSQTVGTSASQSETKTEPVWNPMDTDNFYQTKYCGNINTFQTFPSYYSGYYGPSRFINPESSLQSQSCGNYNQALEFYRQSDATWSEQKIAYAPQEHEDATPFTTRFAHSRTATKSRATHAMTNYGQSSVIRPVALRPYPDDSIALSWPASQDMLHKTCMSQTSHEPTTSPTSNVSGKKVLQVGGHLDLISSGRCYGDLSPECSFVTKIASHSKKPPPIATPCKHTNSLTASLNSAFNSTEQRDSSVDISANIVKAEVTGIWRPFVVESAHVTVGNEENVEFKIGPKPYHTNRDKSGFEDTTAVIERKRDSSCDTCVDVCFLERTGRNECVTDQTENYNDENKVLCADSDTLSAVTQRENVKNKHNDDCDEKQNDGDCEDPENMHQPEELAIKREIDDPKVKHKSRVKVRSVRNAMLFKCRRAYCHYASNSKTHLIQHLKISHGGCQPMRTKRQNTGALNNQNTTSSSDTKRQQSESRNSKFTKNLRKRQPVMYDMIDIEEQFDNSNKDVRTEDFVCNARKQLTGRKMRRRRSNLKRHACAYCTKKFETPRQRHVHELIHTGERPYKCTHCEFTCRNPSYLLEHGRRMHAVIENPGPGAQTQNQCSICFRSFKTPAAKAIHEIRHTVMPNSEKYPKRRASLSCNIFASNSEIANESCKPKLTQISKPFDCTEGLNSCTNFDYDSKFAVYNRERLSSPPVPILEHYLNLYSNENDNLSEPGSIKMENASDVATCKDTIKDDLPREEAENTLECLKPCMDNSADISNVRMSNSTNNLSFDTETVGKSDQASAEIAASSAPGKSTGQESNVELLSLAPDVELQQSDASPVAPELDSSTRETKYRSTRELKCSFCPRLFNRNAHRVNHEMVHKREIDSKNREKLSDRRVASSCTKRSYRCAKCRLMFDSLLSLRSHIQEIHMLKTETKSDTSKSQYQCKTCFELFITHRTFTNHMRKCTKDTEKENLPDWLPNDCQEWTAKANNLSDNDSFNGDKTDLKTRPSFHCRYCTRRFTRPGHRVNHEKVHKRHNDSWIGSAKLHDQLRHKSEPMKRHECTYCGKSYAKRYDRQKHEVYEHEGGVLPHQCHQCDYKTWKRSSLIAHEHLHTADAKYTCAECDIAFTSNKAMRFHETRMHRPLEMTSVNTSKKIWVSIDKKSANNPAVASSPEKPSHCLINEIKKQSDENCDPEDDASAPDSDTLSNTENSLKTTNDTKASNDKIHKCVYCGELFENNKDLMMHVIKTHVIKTKSDKQFRRKTKRSFLALGTETREQDVTHRKKPSLTKTVNQHSKGVTYIRITGKREAENTDKVERSQCEPDTNRPRKLQASSDVINMSQTAKKLATHGYIKEEDASKSAQETDMGYHACMRCDYVTPVKSHMARHDVIDRREGPVKCQYCSKSFCSKQSAASHCGKIHKGRKLDTAKNVERKEAVEETNEDSDRLNSKSNEEMSETEAKITCTKDPVKSESRPGCKQHDNRCCNFSCRFCDKKFFSRLHRRYHESSHTGDKPYRCAYCDFRSSQKGNLKTHELVHTRDGETYKCTECNYSTNSSYFLRLHMQTAHGERRSNENTEGSLVEENTASSKIATPPEIASSSSM